MNRLLDKLLADNLAAITGKEKPQVRVERYWANPNERWFTDHAEARKLTGMVISTWICQRGKKELNDKKPPAWGA